MVDSKTIPGSERKKLERTLLEELQRIGNMIKDITPDGGHLSMTWFPDGHADVSLFSGQRIQNEYGGTESVFILDAWSELCNGKLEVHRV